MRSLPSCLAFLMLSSTLLAQEWVNISEEVAKKAVPEGKKQNYGPTAGVTVDPATGDVYMVISDNGLWKSPDQGKTWDRVDNKTISGRTETGYALNFDPAGKRLACFMIYGSSAHTDDSGKTFTAFKTSHLDFGAVDWDKTGKTFLSFRHEKQGTLTISNDAGVTWKDLDKGFKGLGLFDAKTLMGVKGNELHRSGDAGTTWEKVTDAKVLAPLMAYHKGKGYWSTDKGFITSEDQGKTWKPSYTVDGVFGPWFGKDEQHIVVVGKKGFQESTDGGKTWAVVAPLPATFTVGLVGMNYAWDVKRNIFYASTMGKHTFKYERK